MLQVAFEAIGVTSMAISEQEWGEVYAKAWADEEFRTLLEQDPTSALQKFAAEAGKNWDTLVAVPPNPAESSSSDEENCLHLVSCC